MVSDWLIFEATHPQKKKKKGLLMHILHLIINQSIKKKGIKSQSSENETLSVVDIFLSQDTL